MGRDGVEFDRDGHDQRLSRRGGHGLVVGERGHPAGPAQLNMSLVVGHGQLHAQQRVPAGGSTALSVVSQRGQPRKDTCCDPLIVFDDGRRFVGLFTARSGARGVVQPQCVGAEPSA
ncbi:MAG: hypothetical protein ABS81_09390 [Pseudonocardia sp. SCN 72-86]|nr:MAG: hypothetical protein ABS81_09390 [Pseudonocardia sp. SCN 72-86]